MNIKQLKELIKDLPDNTPIITSSSDHSYRRIDSHIGSALYFPDDNAWSEDYGDEEGAVRRQALIIN